MSIGCEFSVISPLNKLGFRSYAHSNQLKHSIFYALHYALWYYCLKIFKFFLLGSNNEMRQKTDPNFIFILPSILLLFYANLSLSCPEQVRTFCECVDHIGGVLLNCSMLASSTDDVKANNSDDRFHRG